ncbi:MAG: glutathione S-transferase family protein [Hyphomicrobiales bacterium]|nr:MAG: glutathione S-transferase family protein [Hyphomicrobiales bacterium]
MTTQTKPIDLYYTGTPNGRKITIMLEELGDVPFTVHPISISKGDQFKPEFLEISPNNKIPAIVDPEGPDGKPISIFESGAILKYLAEKFGRFYGKSWSERVKIDEWLFWQVGGFGPMLGQANHFAVYAKEKIPYAIDRYINETHRLYRVLNTQLEKQAQAGKDFIAGDDLSIADFAIFDWSNGYANYAIDEAEFPFWKQWHTRMKARPAVAKALAFKTPEKPVDLSKDDDAQKILFGQR